MPTKILVTNRSALSTKYGTYGWSRIDQAVKGLVAADAARGITTTLIALDDAGLGAALARTGDARSFKVAIDHVAEREPKPDYLVLLGGPDVVPHQLLQNPVAGDDVDVDKNVPSDLPYACTAGPGETVDAFIGPTRAVGRLPDLPNERDPTRLVHLLETAAAWTPRPSAGDDIFCMAALVWKDSTTLALQALCGPNGTVHLSPSEGPEWSATHLKAAWHFINCHGSHASSDYYGQKDQSYPISHQGPTVLARASAGTVVAAECCYGAELYDPALATAPGISVSYLAAGAIAFLGSTNIAYGGSDATVCADCLCRDFLEQVRRGVSLGRALLEARLAYVRRGGALGPTDLKTLGQFILLGDPSLRAVAPSPFERFTSGKPALRAHDARRRILEGQAADALRTVPRAEPRPSGSPSTPVRTRLEREAAAAGYAPVGQARTFETRRGDGPSSPGSGAGQTRFHVMAARRTGGLRAMVSSAFGSVSPVTDRLLIVAREVNGEVVGIERLYARTAADSDAVTAEGMVVKRAIARGSKSEHDAVLLESERGTLILRRRDGNPFVDPVLDALVGHRVRFKGELTELAFFVREWTVIDRSE